MHNLTTLSPILHQFWIFSATIFINKFYNVVFLCIVLLRHVMCFLSTASTPEETSPPPTTSPTQTVGAVITTGTVPVSSSTQRTNNPSNNLSSDGTTTTSVITVVAVVIILVVIVVGVIILVVLFRAKKRKQLLVLNKLQNVTIENQDIEMKLKQEETIEKEANSSTCLPPYAEIRTETQPKVPNKSEELVEYLNLKSTVIGEYSEIELEQDDSKHALPSNPPRQVNISDPISEEIQCNPVYQDIDQQPSTTSVQEAEVYTVPDTTSSPTVGKPSGTYETVYSEPIQPSLFTDATESPSYSDSLKPYAPIYTLPINLPKSKEVLLKVFGSNIQEIRELGMGQFGKVILAETVGLSAKESEIQ